jgi:hypothetical protein
MTVMTSHLQKKSLSAADEVRTYPKTRIEIFRLGGHTVARTILEPGGRWDNDLGKAVGKDLCSIEHGGYLMSGRMGVRMDDGQEIEARAGDLVSIPPNHQAWVFGNERAVSLDFAGGEAFGGLS